MELEKEEVSVKTFSAIIVDDEPDAREILQSLLEEHPDINVVATASSVSEALPIIIDLEPDLLFLDIKMPNKSGFDLILELQNLRLDCNVIFVTAYDEFAVKAIKASALDYLLKPVDPSELAEALVKFRIKEKKELYRKKLESFLFMVNQSSGIVNKIRFNTRTGYFLVNHSDILYLKADRSYTEMHLLDGKIEILSYSLGIISKSLSDLHFQRFSRSLIVNKLYLSAYNRITRTIFLNVKGQEMSIQVK